ncbi:MAG: thymidylate synthase, partial [Mycobacterium sp.]|nr:thymidylate synthase [Mycobacterium sp.]
MSRPNVRLSPREPSAGAVRLGAVAMTARVFAVAETAPLHVQLIARTEFVAPPDVPWSTDADGGQALVEFAGRACYQSWSKPNPKTAT